MFSLPHHRYLVDPNCDPNQYGYLIAHHYTYIHIVSYPDLYCNANSDRDNCSDQYADQNTNTNHYAAAIQYAAAHYHPYEDADSDDYTAANKNTATYQYTAAHYHPNEDADPDHYTSSNEYHGAISDPCVNRYASTNAN